MSANVYNPTVSIPLAGPTARDHVHADLPSRLTLDRLPPGVQARVAAVHLQGPERRRMMDLGFMPGASISVELGNPMGDPRAFRVMDGVIAVRREQARGIDVEILGEEREA